MPELKSLRLAEFSDFDLLHALAEVADEDGWATADDVAQQIGITHKRPTQCVGARFAWLNRFGLMEQEPDKERMKWRLNEIGEALLFPRKQMPAAISKAMEKLDESQLIALTDLVAKDLPIQSRQVAHLARRAWRHHFGEWRDPLLFVDGRGR